MEVRGAILGVVVCASFVQCQAPTEVKVALSTDVPCEKLKGVSITVGGRDDTEKKEPATTSTTCEPNGDLGTLTIVPSGSKSDEVVIRVVGGVGRDPESCTAPYGTGCIVSRRAIRFVENKPLTLKIALKNACNGVACSPDQTCVEGSCTGYSVLDAASCGADGCGDGVLPKSNGIPLPPSPLVCGDMGGLQPGAPWPMLGGCPTHAGRSAFTGPSFSHLRWTFTADAPINSGIAIAADGTIYFGADDHKLYAVDSAGRLKWATAIATDTFDSTVPAIAADGTVLIGSVDTNLYAVSPRGDLVWTHPIGGKQFPSPAIGGDGTIYVGGGGGQSSVFALDKTGAEKWSFPTGSDLYASPALGFAGTVHVGSEDQKFYTLGLDGKERWHFDVGEGNSSSSIGPNGTIYFVGKGSVCALDKDGKLVWVNPTKGDATLPSIGGDGSMYIATSGGWLYGIGPDGKYLWNKQITEKFNSGNQAVIGANGALYIGALDNIFYAFEPNGDVLWQLVTGGPIRGAAALGADGTLYFGSQDGKLYAVGSP